MVRINRTSHQLSGSRRCNPDANNGAVVGNNGLILRTTDGGQNWVPQASGTTSQLRAVCFRDANTGTVVGDQGTILRTTDGGQTWVSQTSGVPEVLLGLSCTDAQTATSVGALGVILKTTDGGQNWMRQPSGTNRDLTVSPLPMRIREQRSEDMVQF
jgi:photosystem II stability/assembly factor-like uncharacterized protein